MCYQCEYKELVPWSDKHFVGVELEFISKYDQEYLLMHLTDAGLEDYINLKDDGSIDYTDEHPHSHEINILAPQTQIKRIVKQVCSVLQDLECVVNYSCGLHVHLDMRNRDKEKCFANLVAAQPLLYSMVSKSRRNNNYCRPTEGTNWRLTEKYQGVNSLAYSRYKTLEVRIHSGTLNATKITNWIDLLVKIIEGKKTTPIVNIQQAVRVFKLNRQLASYVNKRIQLFQDDEVEAA